MYLLKLVTNTQGQHAPSVEVSDSLDYLKVKYHQTLASYYNAPDVAKGVVSILDDNGRTIPSFTEIVVHQVEPNDEDDPMAIVDRSENDEP